MEIYNLDSIKEQVGIWKNKINEYDMKNQEDTTETESNKNREALEYWENRLKTMSLFNQLLNEKFTEQEIEIIKDCIISLKFQ